jgi:long-chain fatty acid transport protein
MVCCRFLRMRSPGWTATARLAAIGVALLSAAAPLLAQTASPTPNFEDEFAYPQVRLGLATGSGARALGMGGAFIARPDDATASTWNPAGLSYLRRAEISAAGLQSTQGSRAVAATGELVNDDRLRSLSPDFLAAAYPLSIGEVTGAAQLSFQRVIPFGGSRDVVRGAQSQLDTSGGFDVYAAGVGAQLSRKLRVGATVNHWANGFGVDRSTSRASGPVSLNTRLKLSGWNFNLGGIFSPWPDLNIGIVAKTPFVGNVSLDRSRIDFVAQTVGLPPRVAADSSGETTTNQASRDDLRLHFPGALGVGASWRISTPLTVSVDFTRTFWSHSYIENFFEVPKAGPPTVFDRLPFPTLRGPDQSDTQQIRAGIEYVVIRNAFKWPLRVGYVNDRQYFQAASGPPHFNAFTFGTGIIAGPLLFDIAYVHERGDYREPGPSEDVLGQHWTTTSNRFFASLIYRLSDR